MTRYVPKYDKDAWRIYDTLLRRFAAGYSAKRYDLKGDCLTKCAALNTSERGTQRLAPALVALLLVLVLLNAGCTWKPGGYVNPLWLFSEPDRGYRTIPAWQPTEDGVVIIRHDFFSQC